MAVGLVTLLDPVLSQLPAIFGVVGSKMRRRSVIAKKALLLWSFTACQKPERPFAPFAYLLRLS